MGPHNPEGTTAQRVSTPWDRRKKGPNGAIRIKSCTDAMLRSVRGEQIRNGNHEAYSCRDAKLGLHRGSYACLCAGKPRLYSWRAGAQSQFVGHAPADAHLSKPDPGSAPTTPAAARDQRPLIGDTADAFGHVGGGAGT